MGVENCGTQLKLSSILSGTIFMMIAYRFINSKIKANIKILHFHPRPSSVVISPILGIFLGGIDFSQLSITVGQAQIMYGNFINSVISFLIIAFVLFMVVKAINTAKEKMSRNKAVEEAAEEAAPSKEEVLLTEIRDLLKK